MRDQTLQRRSPILFVLLAIASIQMGSAVAKGLFDQVSPLGVACLRLSLGAILMVGLTRPRWRHYRGSDYCLLGGLGLAMGVMSALLYSALAYIPLGVAVTLEFMGPLGLALCHARRWRDALWGAMAIAGVILLNPFDVTGFHPLGMGLALAAGGCWAAYILLSARVGQVFEGTTGVTLAMGVGAIALLPVGLATDGWLLLAPPVLLVGLGVALLAAVIPYSLEMTALRRIPVGVFGVLMSLEPMVASIVGVLILGEYLNFSTAIAIGLVTLASVGATRSQSAAMLP
jgi:inner membrane transporter RhtA